jgi:glycosyltransferase involved in cell wall biosynthesis
MRRDIGQRSTPCLVESYHAIGMGIPPSHQRIHQLLAARRDAVVVMAPDDGWSRFAAKRRNMDFRTILNGASDPRVDLIDAEGRRAYRQQQGIPDSCRLVVGTVGMLRTDRKPWLWIPVFARIAGALGTDVHFLIAGGGPEQGRLEASIEQHGLAGRVHITGVVDRAREPLSIIDLFVTVNVGRVTGVAALEAAMAGLPIIALQFVDGYRSGPGDWIWSDSEPVTVGDRAVELLRDTAARRSLALTQQDYARRNHSVEAMGEAYLNVYRAVIARRRRDVAQ